MLDEAEITKKRKKFTITNVTKFPAMQIQYVGPFLFATVQVAAGGDMKFFADDVNGTTTVDPDIGWTSEKTALGIIDLSTPDASMNTFGELERHINSMANWRCYLIGVPRDLGTDDKLDTLSAASCRTDNGITLFVDEAKSGNLDVGFAITNQKFSFRPSLGWQTRHKGVITDELCFNTLEMLKVNLTNLGSGNIEIYSIDDIGEAVSAAPVLIWDNAYATATEEKHGDTVPVEEFISSLKGQRLLIYFDVTSATITACDVEAVGNTKHVRGSQVHGANYTGIV